MRATEFIRKLEHFVAVHGDLEVNIYAADYPNWAELYEGNGEGGLWWPADGPCREFLVGGAIGEAGGD